MIEETATSFKEKEMSSPTTTNTARPATRKQMAFLKRLAIQKGIAPVMPRTSWQASRQIEVLLAAKPRHDIAEVEFGCEVFQ